MTPRVVVSPNEGNVKKESGRLGFLFSIAALASIIVVSFSTVHASELRSFTISNGVAKLTVAVDSGRIAYERLALNASWARKNDGTTASVESDGNFAIDIFWTGWSAPGKVNNANNAVTFTKKNFELTGTETEDTPQGGKQLNLFFKGIGLPFRLEVSYELDSAAFYVHRRISISDTVDGLQYLRRIWTTDVFIKHGYEVVKDGGFGQPVALTSRHGGSFWGLEYPAGINHVTVRGKDVRIKCGEVFGKRIGSAWTRSHWAVEGLTPNRYVKLWFMRYVTRIRVVPAQPYTLYNTWFDLRSPRYPGITPDHIMNQANIVRIIDELRKNMIEKHGIRLNAFVLDDGWDKYESDWKLRSTTFPNGLKPIVDDLKKTNTVLGLWLSPIGGYSFRNLRVGWMKAHGFETVGDELCLGGKHYSRLFKKRVVGFAKDDGVGYYKWDGIQFSCSQPDHGHPVGIYSRDAILDTLINISRAVRKVNPHAYLNITSGTWLSPWWVKYANQIWMQGGDYGYADVPSISPRDAAMTYRDLVLYDDFRTNDFWFPIANLMTHGIIKGTLEQLGGSEEPLDRFTNEAVLYFARGVSMWELYVSPDILTEGEWDAISKSILWARNRFPILSNTDMIGGDPGKRETYGYVHFKGNEGIVAARNPWIEPSTLKVTLSASEGFAPGAKSLVVERVYPDRWISPRLYASGQSFEIPLEGYETAVYEIFPLDSAHTPLISDVRFERKNFGVATCTLDFYDAGRNVKLLNPLTLGLKLNRNELNKELSGLKRSPRPVAVARVADIKKGGSLRLRFDLNIDESVKKSSLDLLLEPEEVSSITKDPDVTISIDGKAQRLAPLKSDSKSKWYTVSLVPGKHTIAIGLSRSPADSGWKGKASVWVSYRQTHRCGSLTFELRKASTARPMPPRELPSNETESNTRILRTKIDLN